MTMLQVERHQDVGAFFERVEPFLLRSEAAHSLLIGFRAPLERDPHAYGDADPYLAAAIDESGAVVAVAARTPPYNLVLSLTDDDRATDALAADLAGEWLPGVIAPVAVGEAFLARRGGSARIVVAQRVFEATEVIAPRPVAGALRAYGDGDRELVLEWVAAFFAEAMPGTPEGDAEGFLVRRLDEPTSRLVLWDDDGPRSFAAFGSPTPNGMRIGPVYTPPELRGRGYASSLTAAVTERVLAERRLCFLSTDLANPTSNSIYQRIGYRPVIDFNVWHFDGRP
jgi:uncharacterized protein